MQNVWGKPAIGGNLACPAGVEPATYGLEGRCSIQLSYGQILAGSISELIEKMVGVQGFEPWTPCSQSRCATRLRYTPTEPIFYTERAISGKSCNIRLMIAHYSSTLKKQINASFAALLLAICIVGTHWVGLKHGVSHFGVSNQTACSASSLDCTPSASHSAEVCHLFDALTMAGCIPPSPHLVNFGYQKTVIILQTAELEVKTPSLVVYQSQAPPSFIL